MALISINELLMFLWFTDDNINMIKIAASVMLQNKRFYVSLTKMLNLDSFCKAITSYDHTIFIQFHYRFLKSLYRAQPHNIAEFT